MVHIYTICPYSENVCFLIAEYYFIIFLFMHRFYSFIHFRFLHKYSGYAYIPLIFECFCAL